MKILLGKGKIMVIKVLKLFLRLRLLKHETAKRLLGKGLNYSIAIPITVILTSGCSFRNLSYCHTTSSSSVMGKDNSKT